MAEYVWKDQHFTSIKALRRGVRKVFRGARVSIGTHEMHVCYANAAEYIFDVAQFEGARYVVCSVPKITR